MRALSELISDDPALPLLEEWVAASPDTAQLVPPPTDAGAALTILQVTTRSFLGTLVYSTGGITINGWLRIWGGGSEAVPRKLVPPGTPFSEDADAVDGMILVGDDVVGGFFALDSGALSAPGSVHYLSPDGTKWEDLEMGHGAWVEKMLSGGVGAFYGDLRWDGYDDDVKTLRGNQCFSFFPPLWATEGSVEKSDHRAVPVLEMWGIRREGI
jgi:hypothetical protein